MSPVDRAGSVTGINFALGSYEKFQPGFRDEKRSKILGTSSGAKFGKHRTHRKFYKGLSGEARSRKPGQPGPPGSYEEALSMYIIKRITLV